MDCVFNVLRICPTPDVYGACYNCKVMDENALQEVPLLESDDIYSEDEV